MWYNIFTPIQQQVLSRLQINQIRLQCNQASLWLLPVVLDWRPCNLAAKRGFFSIIRTPKMKRLPPGEQLRRDEMFRQGMLWCAQCKQFHPVKDFKKMTAERTNYGYRRYCCRCESNQWKDRAKDSQRYFKRRNSGLKEKFAELAGGCCQRCGYKEFYPGLDFHHVYPAEKQYFPAYIIYSADFEKTWKELDKCCLLCQNCHAGYEAGLWRAEFIKRDGLGWTVGGELPLDDKRYEATKPPKYNQSPLPLFAPKRAGEQLALFERLTPYVA